VASILRPLRSETTLTSKLRVEFAYLPLTMLSSSVTLPRSVSAEVFSAWRSSGFARSTLAKSNSWFSTFSNSPFLSAAAASASTARFSIASAISPGLDHLSEAALARRDCAGELRLIQL